MEIVNQVHRPFDGMRIVEDLSLVVDGDPIEVRRTWKERLFSRPWRPFKRNKTVIPKVPSEEVLVILPNTIVAHPITAREVRRIAKEHL